MGTGVSPSVWALQILSKNLWFRKRIWSRNRVLAVSGLTFQKTLTNYIHDLAKPLQYNRRWSDFSQTTAPLKAVRLGLFPTFNRGKKKAKPIGWLVRIGYKSLRILHLAPIKVVVYDQPIGISSLGGGLTLRCFQRLSFPNIATRPLPLAGQPEHQRFVSLGPLVLKRTPLQISYAHIR